MKALLILDKMPDDCKECPLNSHTEYDFDVCWITQGKGDCPLRPIPTDAYNALIKGLDAWERMTSVEISYVRRTE